MSGPRARRGSGLGDLVLLVAVAAIGLGSLSAFRVVADSNARTYDGRLAADLTEVDSLLERAAGGVTVAPTAVAGLVATVGPELLTRQSFASFTAPLLDDELLIALEWAPRVLLANRTAFEDAVRFQGLIDFAIVERSADGTRVPAASRPDYFPILHSEPFGDNEQSIGNDLGFDPVRRAAIERARDAAVPVATSPVDLAIGGTGVLVMIPVYAGGSAPDGVADRAAAFLGVAVARYRPDELLGRATLGVDLRDLSVYLFDLGPAGGAGGEAPVLAAHRIAGGADDLDGSATLEEARTPGSVVTELEFASRRYLVVLSPGPAYAAALLANPWPVTLAGAAAAIAVGLYGIQRRRFEGALRSAAARLRGVLSASPDAFIGLSASGRIVDWSDQATRLFAVAREEALGRPVADLLELPGEGGSAPGGWDVATAFSRLAEPGESTSLELVALRPDAVRIPVDVTMAVSPSTSRWAIACFVRDATERYRARDELLRARATETIGELTGRLAHDFNNLLGIVVGTLDLARDDLDDRPETQRLVDMALAAGVRGADVTRSLLAVARRQALAPADIDLNEVAREVAPLLRQAVGAGVEVVLDLHPEPLVSHLDSGGLTNAILNLTINGSHAMPDGGRVTVRTRPGLDRGSIVEVADTGVGIPPEQLARVFEPFFTTKKGGTGLGLAIVLGFANQSGGSAEIESTVGEGTTVRLKLPPAHGTELPAAAPVPMRTDGTERIVVVDDESGLREIAATWLRNAGYAVTTAGSGPEGLAAVLDAQPQLLLTDVIMPGEYGGLELARRARDAFPDLRIVLASGFAGVDLEGVIESGIPLLEKPYRRQALVEAVRGGLDAPVPIGSFGHLPRRD